MIKFFDFLNFSNFYDLYFFDFRFFQIFSILAFKHSENETNFAANPYTILDKHHSKKNTLNKMPFSIKEKSFKPLYTEQHKHKIDKEQKTHFHQKHYQYSTTTTINTRINNN